MTEPFTWDNPPTKEDLGEEWCDVGHPGDPCPHMHCTCWWDGDGCCRCKAPALTDEERAQQGMEEVTH